MGQEAVENPFRIPGVRLLQSSYTDETGVLRLKTVVEHPGDDFLLGVHCDTTLKFF